MRLREESGVTAVELAVVLVIIAVLAAATYPLLSNVLQVMSSKGAAEQVAGAIRQARQYAITRGSNYCIKFGTTPDTQYSIAATADTTAASCTLDTSDPTTSRNATIGNGDAVMSPNNLSIIFDPIGNVLNQGTTTPYVVQVGIDTQPASCLSTVGITLYGGVRAIKC